MDPATDRPDWAVNLPDRATLDYVRALGGAALVMAIVVWLALVIVRDPAGILRIARKRVGA